MSKNIIKYIKNPDIIGIIDIVDCGEKYTCESMSSFELFDAWEKVMPLAAGHRAEAEYRAFLSQNGFSVPNFGEYSRERSCNRWRRMNGLPDVSYTQSSKNKLCFQPKNTELVYFCLNDCVSEITTKCDSYKELSSLVKTNVKIREQSVNTISIDFLNCSYRRPDIYSAEIAFKKIKCDEILNCCERFTLISELLIEQLLNMRKEGVNLNIYLRGNSQAAFELLEYLKKRKLFCGKAYIDIDKNTDAQRLWDCSLNLLPDIRICPILNPDGAGNAWLSELFYSYPAGACKAGKNCTRELLSDVLDGVCENHAHRDMLLEFIF